MNPQKPQIYEENRHFSTIWFKTIEIFNFAQNLQQFKNYFKCFGLFIVTGVLKG